MSLLALSLALALQASSGPAEAETEVGAILDQLHAAASAAEGEAYFALFTPDARFIGTDVAERWTVEQFKAYAMPYFSQGKGWSYTPRTRTVTITTDPCACQAWFDEVLDSQSYGTARGSGVLTRTARGWKVAQYVLSFPVPNNIAGDVTDQIKAFEAAH